MADAVLYEDKGDGIVVVTLNDAKTRNALGDEIIDGIVKACARINADTTVRCTLTTNDGKRYGATLKLTDDQGAFEVEVDRREATS